MAPTALADPRVNIHLGVPGTDPDDPRRRRLYDQAQPMSLGQIAQFLDTPEPVATIMPDLIRFHRKLGHHMARLHDPLPVGTVARWAEEHGRVVELDRVVFDAPTPDDLINTLATVPLVAVEQYRRLAAVYDADRVTDPRRKLAHLSTVRIDFQTVSDLAGVTTPRVSVLNRIVTPDSPPWVDPDWLPYAVAGVHLRRYRFWLGPVLHWLELSWRAVIDLDSVVVGPDGQVDVDRLHLSKIVNQRSGGRPRALSTFRPPPARKPRRRRPKDQG